VARQPSMSAVDRRSHEGDPWARGDRPAASRRGSVTLNLIRATLVGSAVGLAGCGSLPRNAVPVELMSQATVADMPEVRAAGGRPSAVMGSDLARSFEQESAAEFPVGPDGLVHYAHLALSGGGANGAFGAGLLVGWTKSGKRPPFKIVTGVSTGALMAPFAFLGSEHDAALTEFYTTTSSLNIFRMLSIIPQLLGGESLADTGPLRQMIEQQVDAELLRRIAEEHNRGRRLYIATVDLDSQRVWIWNMGMIASSGRPGAGNLFRQVMLASASVPLAFPPVFIDVEAGGQRFDEMHVDGGVGARVFFSGGVFSFTAARAGTGCGAAREELYIIHNGQLLPAPDTTPRSLRGIALRTFESASKSAVVGDLFRIYAVTLRERAGFNWVTIPENVELVGNELFDPVKMRELYDLGHRRALTESPWMTDPPGLRWSASP
jgi:Patatin-like phospholipase